MAGRAAAKGDGDRATRRMVLERVRVIVVPPGTEESNDELVRRAVTADGVQDAWVERGEFTGSKVQAIEAYAGKPGSPDAKVGEFKAPPARGWQGGVRHVQPALPKVEREVLK